MSKGEEKIEKILKENNLNYKREYSFSNLIGYKGAPLRYDFAIFDFFGKVRYLIEYDGEEHFSQIKYFNKTKKEFNYRQELDRRKNRYAICNNIILIRIPYWDLNNITYNSIFSTQDYVVKTVYHNDILARNREVK